MRRHLSALMRWMKSHTTAQPARKAALVIAAAALLAVGALPFVESPPASAAAQLFTDDFEADALGSPPQGWTAVSGPSWTVAQDGARVLQQGDLSGTISSEIAAGSPTWTDYVLQVDVKPGVSNLNLATVIEARFVDTNNHYSFLLKNNSEWYLGKKVNAIWTTLAQGTFSYRSQFYTLTLSVQGSVISCAINGIVMATKSDTSFASGMIALSAKANSEFDNVLVTGGAVSPTPTPTSAATSPPTSTATPAPTNTATPAPTSTATPTPTGIPAPTETPPLATGGVAQFSVTTSSAGVMVQSLDANLDGWSELFNSAVGGVITNDGQIDHGVYTELEAQNTYHGRLQIYLATSGGVWLSNLQNPGTITVLRNSPTLVELQTVSANKTYGVKWTSTYTIWPGGETYVHLQVTNTGSSAIKLLNGQGLEIDLGGLPLTFYKDQAPNAWYVTSGGLAVSPIPTSATSGEPLLFGDTPTGMTANMGYLLDKFTSWKSVGASSGGFVGSHNTYRSKDAWYGSMANLSSGRTLSFLLLFDQRRSLTQSQSLAIDADYRTPAVTVNVGALAASDNEPAAATVLNGFNVHLGAYVIGAVNNHINATLAFPAGVTTRFAPRFKVTGWTGVAPVITWGGQSLINGDDYTYLLDAASQTLYVQLAADVVAANPVSGQLENAPLDISWG